MTCKSSRTMIRLLLLAGLVFAASPRVWSQSDSRAPQKSAQTDKQRRGAASGDSSLDQAAQDKEREIQAQMDQLRLEEERERLNLMRYHPDDPFERVMRNLGPIFVFMIFLGATLWIVRVILENRRWNRTVKIQSEAHAKLLERMSSSQEMLAYMDSEAGKRFLESRALDVDPAHSAAVPYSRILWSAQAGLIIGMLGVGLLLLRGHIQGDGSGNGDTALLLFGTIGLTLGLGFLLSGIVSYVLSKRFGLLDRPKDSLAGTEPGAPRG
jgi:hypothetical protein